MKVGAGQTVPAYVCGTVADDLESGRGRFDRSTLSVESVMRCGTNHGRIFMESRFRNLEFWARRGPGGRDFAYQDRGPAIRHDRSILASRRSDDPGEDRSDQHPDSSSKNRIRREVARRMSHGSLSL